MPASTPTTSAGAAGRAAAGRAGGGTQACHPRTQAAMPWATSNAAPRPARGTPSDNARQRRAS